MIWPLWTVLNESEREADLATGTAALKGEVVDGREKVNGIIDIDGGETGTDAIQEDVMMTMKSFMIPSEDNHPWTMLSVSTRGHIIPAKDFTPLQRLPSLGVSILTTHIRVLLEHRLPPVTDFLRQS